MDNLTHSLTGGLLAQLGLKRVSRFGVPAMVMGANAPDIDVFAPLFWPVENIAFHRGPTHAVIGWPVMALGTVALLWLVHRLWPPKDGREFRFWPLVAVTLLAVMSHSLLDFLNTYAVNIMAPFSSRWVGGDAIFIIDLVYWALLVGGIAMSRKREKRAGIAPGLPVDLGARHARPAWIAAAGLAGYMLLNLGISGRAEALGEQALRARGIAPEEVIASPPPLLFWKRSLLWRDSVRYGRGDYVLGGEARMDEGWSPRNLDDPRLAEARARDPHVRGFLYWSRAPLVVERDGKAFLTDQRFHAQRLPFGERRENDFFMIPLDPPGR